MMNLKYALKKKKDAIDITLYVKVINELQQKLKDIKEKPTIPSVITIKHDISFNGNLLKPLLAAAFSLGPGRGSSGTYDVVKTYIRGVLK